MFPILRIYHSPHTLRVSPVPLGWDEVAKVKAVWMTTHERKTITTKNTFCIFGYAMLVGIIEGYIRMASGYKTLPVGIKHKRHIMCQ
jgi:hypothetical protein